MSRFLKISLFLKLFVQKIIYNLFILRMYSTLTNKVSPKQNLNLNSSQSGDKQCAKR